MKWNDAQGNNTWRGRNSPSHHKYEPSLVLLNSWPQSPQMTYHEIPHCASCGEMYTLSILQCLQLQTGITNLVNKPKLHRRLRGNWALLMKNILTASPLSLSDRTEILFTHYVNLRHTQNIYIFNKYRYMKRILKGFFWLRPSVFWYFLISFPQWFFFFFFFFLPFAGLNPLLMYVLLFLQNSQVTHW